MQFMQLEAGIEAAAAPGTDDAEDNCSDKYFACLLFTVFRLNPTNSAIRLQSVSFVCVPTVGTRTCSRFSDFSRSKGLLRL
jgi:hypothetical protein